MEKSCKMYRFSFNGKENDNEVFGSTGSFQDYDMRMYDTRISRFISVDPLTKKYPWYTPFQFAGNMPIKFIDLDGLEPAENPKEDGLQESFAKNTIDQIYRGANDANQPNETKTSQGIIGKDVPNYVTSPMSNTSENSINYISDTKEGPAKEFNMFVSTSSSFYVDESNASKFDNYETAVVKNLLDNFTSGNGPENYVFPTNGLISRKFIGTKKLNQALTAFSENKERPTQWSFGPLDLANDFIKNGSLFTITGFVGSGTITIKKTESEIQIQIFNITSLYSGAYGQGGFLAPKSYVRDPLKTTPYGNISQTFNLSYPLNK